MYRSTGGLGATNFVNGYLQMGSSSRFVIGERESTETKQGEEPKGDLDLSKPYKISFTVTEAGTNAEGKTGKFFVYVDNNKTNKGDSYHGNNSLIYEVQVTELTLGKHVEIQSTIGTQNSFIQIRADSGVGVVGIDDLVIEYTE